MSDIESTIDVIAERLVAAERQSDLGQTFRVFPGTRAVHMDHDSHISYEYLQYAEVDGKTFDESIDWPESAKLRETFDPAEQISGPAFWVERIRPYVENGSTFLVQLQVVEDLAHTDTCGGSEDEPGTGGEGCTGGHDWPAWALMIAEAK